MKRHILISLTVIAIAMYSREVSAFWGNDTKETASGLNVAAGFDINTVGTVSGTVMTPPERSGEEQHTTMTVTTPQGNVTAILGPWWYWERQAVVLSKGQEIAVTGSRAIGKDGSLYLFTQRIEDRTTGEAVILRSETGVPLWSRAAPGSQAGSRQQGGGGSLGRGAGYRGSGSRGGRR
jgi:hypothetical protein